MIMLKDKQLLVVILRALNYYKNILKENKKKFIPLNVSAPFHCSLMRSAAQKMKDKINSTNFKKP